MNKRRLRAKVDPVRASDESGPMPGESDADQRQLAFAEYVRAKEMMHRLRDILTDALSHESSKSTPEPARVAWLQAQADHLGVLIQEIRPSHVEDVAQIVRTFGPMLQRSEVGRS